MGTQTLVLLAAIYAAGIGIGALLAALLWTSRHGNRAANRWLAGACAALAALTFGSLLEDTRMVLQLPQLGHATDPLIAVVGPCVWLYVRRLTGRTGPRGARLVLHFVPALALAALLAPFYRLDGTAKSFVLAAEFAEPPPSPNLVLLIVGMQMLAYWVAAGVRLVRYRRQLREEYSSIEHLAFRWLMLMLVVGIVVWCTWMMGQVWAVSAARLPEAIAVPAALYVLAYFGLRQPAVFQAGSSSAAARSREASPAASAATAAGAPSDTVLLPPPSDSLAVKYERSAVDPARLVEYRSRLETVMDTEKPWLESDLTLTGLAFRVGVSPHHLSQVLNTELGHTFYDYVNARRVAEVQRCLRDPAYADQSILEIALASGFNSKTAFNAAFKAATGQTPSQFRAGAAPRSN